MFVCLSACLLGDMRVFGKLVHASMLVCERVLVYLYGHIVCVFMVRCLYLFVFVTVKLVRELVLDCEMCNHVSECLLACMCECTYVQIKSLGEFKCLLPRIWLRKC